ncbi:MAG: hypothetical protein IPM39_24910 [Chloroflexi bacterium]|nr:hypothetical protein [Chloroflexota bacterium]
MFTYGEGATELINQLRNEVQDNKESPDGVFPLGENFGDDHLTYLYHDESQHLGRFTARCCEILARAYARFPTASRLGPSDETLKAADYYSAEARRLRQLYGYPNNTGIRYPFSGSVPFQSVP